MSKADKDRSERQADFFDTPTGQIYFNQPTNRGRRGGTSGHATRRAARVEQQRASGPSGGPPPGPDPGPAPGPAPDPPGKPRHTWRWLLAGLVVMLVAFGIFTYIRVSSFVDNSFNGRNEASLLEATATPKPRPTVTPYPGPAGDEPASNRIDRPTATPGFGTGASSGASPGAGSGASPGAGSGASPGAGTVPAATATPAPPTPTSAATNSPLIQKIKQGEKITVLVTGFGGGNHDGSYLTDTILLATYDPLKNAVTLVNLPRDLYVFVPYAGPKAGYWGKINSAFAQVMEASSSNGFSPRYRFNPNDQKSKIDAGVNLLKDIVEQVTGTPVDYWATFSFDGFRKFINAIGGVYVNVETAFDDYEYPTNDDPSVDASVMHVHFDAGLQLMNGEKAIQYARSRKSVQDGSDFGRSKRQMKLIAAVKERVARPDIMLQAFGMMDALQGNMRTSLTLDEGRALMDYYRGEGAAAARNMLFVPQILNGNFLVEGMSSEGAYILYPAAGQGVYSEIREWLEQGRQYPELRYENLKVQVQNGSGQQFQVASKLNAEFESNGLSTLSPIWAQPTPKSVILDYSGGKSSNTLKAISGLLPNIPVQTGKRPAGQTADIVVLLGRDFGQTPAQNGEPPYSQPVAGGQLTLTPGGAGRTPTAAPTVTAQRSS